MSTLNCRVLTTILLLPIICLFTSCAGLGIATTGAQAVYHHNSVGQQLTDHYITMQAYRKLYTDTDEFNDTNISVAVLNSDVLLIGQTPQPGQSAKAEKLIKSIQQVNKVYNYLKLAAPASTLTVLSDSWLTTKIKSQLIAMNDLNPDHIKVVTENGTVFLMGLVFPSEADIAVDIAQNTQGVQEVVKLFYYLHISKT